MRRSLKLGIASAAIIICALVFYASLPVINVTADTPIWASEYDASRQETIYPGPGTPVALAKAGACLRVLWSSDGKDYRAYFIFGPYRQRGWVLYGQRGLSGSAEAFSKPAPNQRDRGDGGIALLSHTERAWPAAPQHRRSAT
jgi:hypothetical protein